MIKKNRLTTLIEEKSKIIREKHPEIKRYYGSSEVNAQQNRTFRFTIEGIVRAYDLANRYGISNELAILSTQEAIRQSTTKQEILERLTSEYTEAEIKELRRKADEKLKKTIRITFS
ncbi:MAG: hypothetical protein Q8P57_01990 [Candidatus Pacearchaeota archaeon]|nr:hypothetical protein [Candidatus Pacearchaeota archaeon]